MSHQVFLVKFIFYNKSIKRKPDNDLLIALFVVVANIFLIKIYVLMDPRNRRIWF